MRPRSSHCLSAALAAWIFVTAAAQAQVNPFRGGPGLSPEDNRLLFESIARLNAAEPAQVGRFATWTNPQTNNSGTSTILRVFRSGGMPCHLLGYHIVVAGRSSDSITASPGAAREAGNGRSGPDPPRVAQDAPLEFRLCVPI